MNDVSCERSEKLWNIVKKKKGSGDFFKNSGSLDQETVLFLFLQNFTLDFWWFFLKGKDDRKNYLSDSAFQMF